MSIPPESYCITSPVTRTTACLAFPHAPSAAICGKLTSTREKKSKRKAHAESESSTTKTEWYLLEGGVSGSNKKKGHFTLAIGPYELDAGNPDLPYTLYLQCFRDHLSQPLL
jgi:hypothetical protein